MKRQKYFISTHSMEQFRFICDKYKFNRDEVVFVPLDSFHRREKIAGHHGVPKDHLIGNFTPEEIHYLMS